MSLPCIVCAGETRPWLDMPMDAKTFKPTAFGKVARCVECGHGSITPLPGPAEVSAFYDLESYYTQGASHMPEETPQLHDRILTRLAWAFDDGIDLGALLEKLELPERGRVCEIGCGHARNLIPLKAAGHVVIGVDPDSGAAAQAAKLGIEVLIGTGEVLPEQVRDTAFDLVIMSHSLEHCIDPSLALRNVESILRPDGLFVCEVPNSACLHFLRNNICSEMFDAPRHLHFYNPTSLQDSVQRAGLGIEAMGYTGFTRHHSRSWRATELRIHRRLAAFASVLPPAHSFLSSAALWLSTFAADAQRKYDSVRVVARKPSVPSHNADQKAIV